MRAVCLALLALLAGCGPSLAEVTAPYRLEMLVQLARARVIGELAAVHPRVTADEVVPGHDPAVWHRTDDSGERMYIRLEDLRALPDHAAAAPWRRTEARVHHCTALVLYGRDPVALEPIQGTVRQTCGDWAERQLVECQALRGLAVIRLHEFALPTPQGCPGASNQPCTFHGGIAAGDVLLYDLAQQRYVGGVPFSAESSPQLSSSTGSEQLIDNLHQKTMQAIQEALARHGGATAAGASP